VRIAFLLPRWSRAPIGGYAVAYEYAERLAALGHETSVVHVAGWTPPVRRSYLAEARRRISSRGRAAATVPWRTGPLTVSSHLSPPWSALAEADTVIATSWRTAEAAAVALPNNLLVYLIQSDEIWSGPAERVVATWRLPVRKVVIARWLEALAAERGAGPVAYVPNAVDVERFMVATPPQERPAASVAMLWHEHSVKGSDVAIAVAEQVRAVRPALDVTAYSIYPRPPGLPGWLHWLRQPSPADLTGLLNRSAIFLSCSRIEGWALPPAEAMASGCALVSSDIGGVADYAHADVTALLAPSEDVAGLAAATVRLIDDDALRLRIAAAGTRHVRTEFSWARSTSELESVVERR
jgi:glycosyltransferase involved in cell wall biosynthesis